MIKAASILLLLLASPPARAEDPDTLWRLISTRCLPGQLDHGDPKPCTEVDLSQGVAHGHAILKDRQGVAQVLTIPTAKITGIEDPQILAPDAPNYFAYAWRAFAVANAAVGHPIPRHLAVVAINSAAGRSQNQLHIHTDCFNADFRAILSAEEASIGPTLAPMKQTIHGHLYRAMAIPGENLDSIDPIRILAADPAIRADMGHHSMLVVGTTLPGGKPGFILLEVQTKPTPTERASVEEILDHACHGA